MGRSSRHSDPGHPARPERGLDTRGPRGPEQLTGIRAVMEAIRARRRKLRVLRVREGSQRPEVAAVVAAAREAGIAVEAIGDPRFAEITSGVANPQGLALEAEPLPELPLESLLGSIGGEPSTLVALDGVEDPQNLGAIARVAEAAGVSGLILPRRRCAPLSPAAARASAGAIEWLPCPGSEFAANPQPAEIRRFLGLRQRPRGLHGPVRAAGSGTRGAADRGLRSGGPGASQGRRTSPRPPGADPARWAGRLAQRVLGGSDLPIRAKKTVKIGNFALIAI